MIQTVIDGSPPPVVSVIVASHNGGQRLIDTVENLKATTPSAGEILVVDDQSTDGSAEQINACNRIMVLRPPKRLGVAAARNFGARHSRGKILVFADAHIEAPKAWFPLLRAALNERNVGAAGAVYVERNPYWGEVKGFGLKITDAGLNWEWLDQTASHPYPVPTLGGFFVGLRREVFWQVGGFDSGLAVYGMDDMELAIRLWLCGYECLVLPELEVGHIGWNPDTVPKYQANWNRGLRNVLRVAVMHFSEARMRRVFQYYVKDPCFPAALAGLAAGNAWRKRAEYSASRTRDDDWFFEFVQMDF